MATKIQLSDFYFQFKGHGHYQVSYTNSKGKVFATLTTDMPLIDKTKNAENPKIKDLQQLKRICKN